MLRGFEMADEIVVLERRGRHKQRVQHDAEQGESPDPSIQAPKHHFG